MSTTTKPAGDRPAGLHPEAMWPPRVRPEGPVTYTDGSVLSTGAVPEGGLGLRVGKVPAPPQPRTDRTTPLPTEGPGAARRAIPAPEEAGTTGTIPPAGPPAAAVTRPTATTTVQRPAPQASAPRAPRVAKRPKGAAR